MSKIYDSFLFFNELDLLEIRLTMLYPHVDYFVLSECDYTFSGEKKPFFFEENKHLFEPFLDKIIHIKNYNSNEYENIKNIHTENKKNIFEFILNEYNKIKTTSVTGYGEPHWCREFLHREFVGLGFDICKDDDIIIFSDLDEIPKPEIISNLKNLQIQDNNYCLFIDNHNYYINNLSNITWMGSVITNYKRLKNNSLNSLRGSRGESTMISDGGWHLSFVGGTDRIKYKLSSYGHQEFNNEYIKSNIKNKINQNSDLFNRFIAFKVIDINGYYPSNIVDLIKNKYPYLIK